MDGLSSMSIHDKSDAALHMILDRVMDLIPEASAKDLVPMMKIIADIRMSEKVMQEGDL
jgi:hypothetical protein